MYQNIEMPVSFAEMLKECPVGMCFTAPLKSSQTAHATAKRLGMAIAVRKQADGEFMVWRIK